MKFKLLATAAANSSSSDSRTFSAYMRRNISNFEFYFPRLQLPPECVQYLLLMYDGIYRDIFKILFNDFNVKAPSHRHSMSTPLT